MKVKLLLEKEDLLTGEKEVLADTTALLNGDTLLYPEKESKARHRVTFSEEDITIERNGETNSVIALSRNGENKITVHSPYGTMEMEASLVSMEKEEGRWFCEYQVHSGSDLAGHMRFVWRIVSLLS